MYNTQPSVERTIREMDKRISALERTRPIPVGSGGPPAGQYDGSLWGDKTGLFLYVVLGGTARKVAVA